MSNDKGLLSGSITILIGAVIAIMALVRGPWQAWLLIGVFTLWGLWVVLILLLPYMQQARRRRQRQQRHCPEHIPGPGTGGTCFRRPAAPLCQPPDFDLSAFIFSQRLL